MKPDHLLPRASVLTRHLCAVLALCCVAAAAQAQLADTGMITCYNATSVTGTVSASTPAPEPSGFEGQDCTRGAGAADVLGLMTKVGSSSIPGQASWTAKSESNPLRLVRGVE